MKIIGIDLAADEKNATGIAEYEDGKIRTFTVYKDKDILEVVEEFKPNLVVVDAPLMIVEKPFRSAEKEMQSLGYSLLPLNTEGMKELAARGVRLKNQIEKVCDVIECHPSSTKKALGVSTIHELKNVKFMNIVKNEHEIDAIFAAVTGVFYLDGLYQQFGDPEEGFIILPKLD